MPFKNNSNLTNVTIPNTITSIDYDVFWGCSSLTNVIIPESVENIGTSVFNGCTSLTEVMLSEGLKSIGNGAFLNCSNLQSIMIPNSVTTIDHSVFPYGMTIYANVGSDGAKALSKSGKSFRVEGAKYDLKYRYEDNMLAGLEILNYDSDVSVAVIPDGVTHIGQSAFWACKKLTDVTIPASVTYIGSTAFTGCTALTYINIPNGVTCIDDSAFCSCQNLTKISLPESITCIGKEAFLDCQNLVSIDIPDSVTEIRKNAFQSCSSLTSVKLPNGLEQISDGLFAYCSELTSIRIPAGVTYIGNDAFNSCRGLKSLVIPEHVRFIGDAAFKACSNLDQICFMGQDTAMPNVGITNTPAIYCYRNSTPYDWAQNQGFDVVFLDDLNPNQYLTVSLPETLQIPIDRNTLLPAEVFSVEPVEPLWSSDDESIVKVNQNGLLTPVNPGTAEITLTVNGKTARSQVTVCPLVTDILTPETFFTLINYSASYIPKVQPDNAVYDLYFEAEDRDYAFASLGEVVEYRMGVEYRRKLWNIRGTAIGRTAVTITDRISGFRKIVPVQIGREISSASFENNDITIRVGQHAQLKAHILMGQYQFENQLVRFRINSLIPGSRSECVSLNPYTGEIVGASPGCVYISISDWNNNVLDTCTVTVTDGTSGNTLQIPYGVTEIKDEAFKGTNADNIMIPYGVTSIGAWAFADSKMPYINVHIPLSVQTIEPDAFDGCTEVVIFGKPGSAAETYANTHDNCSFVAE